MKWTMMALAMVLTSGCFSPSKNEPELLPKLEESKGQDDPGVGTYLFRIFGVDQPFLALYNAKSAVLSHIYRTQVADKGRDFWQQIKEDMRMTRESRYFAASSALNPSAFLKDPQTGMVGGSFRADVFRGDPAKMSSFGRNILFRVTDVVFQSEVQPPTTTHIFVAAKGEFHAVPLNAQENLLSFTIVDGLPEGRPGNSWLAVQIETDGGLPGNTKMGCVSNYAGKILAGHLTEESEISAICEREGRAGPS